MSQYLPTHENSTKIKIGPDRTVYDIRRNVIEDDLKEEVLTSLRAPDGQKILPTMLLYNERGLQLFEEITHLEEYYLTNTEIDILKNSANEIANIVISGSMIVEFGSGNLRKMIILLKALEKQEKFVDYYALDLSLRELNRTLKQVPVFHYLRCYGLYGTYDDGIRWLKKSENKSRPKLVLSLGSSLGNLQHFEAQQFLHNYSHTLKFGDLILIGLDHTDEASKVYHAYNDRKGITHKFILNGLQNANEILGKQVFNLAEWKVVGEFVYDEQGCRHQAYLTPICDFHFEDKIHVRKGERVQIERSLKYSDVRAADLWKDSELSLVSRWSNFDNSYYTRLLLLVASVMLLVMISYFKYPNKANLNLLRKDIMPFKSDLSLYATSNIPTIEEWRHTWRMWDIISKDIVPECLLYERPIKLRNPLIFYLGHIPTFLDIQLSKVLDGQKHQNDYFNQIFERGIDPDVDNPKICHAHSKIPNCWPPIDNILKYQDEVRAKVEALYKTAQISRNVARAIWLAFEHELMHLETFTYSLLQSNVTLQTTTNVPNFEEDARKAKDKRVPNQWFMVPKQKITIGLHDPEDHADYSGPFGWDIEKPPRSIEVPAFQAQARPLTNEDYWNYLEQTKNSKIPNSWVFKDKINGDVNEYTRSLLSEEKQQNSQTDKFKSHFLTKMDLENIFVRTLFWLVPLKYSLDWPVYASYNELAECAKWMNGRIPSFEEARSIYSYVEKQRLEEARRNNKSKSSIDILCHSTDNSNGDHIHRTSSTASSDDSCRRNLFVNIDRANVGFKNWHPVAVTSYGNRLAGQSEMGGVWEWTSSPLARFQGFQPMSLYPGYSADFFDGKHNIILGGSWATHPRIASRKSFVNWYQRNYPHTCAGVRLVRDQ